MGDAKAGLLDLKKMPAQGHEEDCGLGRGALGSLPAPNPRLSTPNLQLKQQNGGDATVRDGERVCTGPLFWKSPIEPQKTVSGRWGVLVLLAPQGLQGGRPHSGGLQTESTGGWGGGVPSL